MPVLSYSSKLEASYTYYYKSDDTITDIITPVLVLFSFPALSLRPCVNRVCAAQDKGRSPPSFTHLVHTLHIQPIRVQPSYITGQMPPNLTFSNPL